MNVTEVNQRQEKRPALEKYRIFGLTISSEYPFRYLTSSSSLETRGSSDGNVGRELTFTVHTEPPEEAGSLKDLEPTYSSPYKTSKGESICYMYRTSSKDLLRFPGAADFYLRRNSIDCHLLEESLRYLVELRLMGPVLSYWLERQGIRTLHSSCVEMSGHAVGFLSFHGGGKTSLAAQLMAEGHALVSDDILPIEKIDGNLWALPSYPQMRMWPEEAFHFLGSTDFEKVHPDLTKVRVPVGGLHWGKFHDAPIPLSALYIAERYPHSGGRVEILPLSPREAVIELVRHSFNPFIVEAIGLQSGRLNFFSSLIHKIPVRHLRYPEGYDLLPEVVSNIRADCS